MHTESRAPKFPELTSRPTILIADGDADTRALYRATFPSTAYDVHQCADGAEALGRAIAGRPDLIIMETHLSRIDGFALCRLLRSDPTTRSVPIVVVTSAAASADIARAVQAGANQVLVKPCDPDVVANAARSALDWSDADAAVPAPQPAVAQPAPPQMPARPIKPRGKSRGFRRHITTTPPANPPDLRCPLCDEGLTYQHSHIGGVNEDSVEQWDYFQCRGCGPYQYRHRTRRLKAI